MIGVRAHQLFARLSFLIVASILFAAPDEAKAQNCPEGFELVSAPYQVTGPDGRPQMVPNFNCQEIGTHTGSAEPEWGAYAAAFLGDIEGENFIGGSSWNYATRAGAERKAIEGCKISMRREGFKGKCRVIGALRNGTGWFTAGNSENAIYMGFSSEEALEKCRAAGETGCAVRRRLVTDGPRSGLFQE